MSKIMDEMKEQVRVETENRIRVETALNLLALSKLSYEEIAKYSGLPIEIIQELAAEQTA